MADNKTKKKNSAKPVLIVFAAIIVVMVIANLRSGSSSGLKGPVGGVTKLKSCENSLVAVSRRKEVYVWDWSKMSAGPENFEFEARKITPLSGNKIVRIAADKDKLILENLDTGKPGKGVFIKYEDGATLLESSKNGKFAVVANPEPELGSITFDTFDSNLNSEDEITAGYPLKPKQVAVSNNGSRIAVTFDQQKGFLVIGKSNNWKYENNEYPAFNELTFSPDGNFLFVSDAERYVYKFDLRTRALVRKFEIKKYKTPPNNPQTITCLTISNNGKIISAGSSPQSRIYVWNAETGEKLKVTGTSFFSASGLGFSPGNNKLAISDLTTRGIKVVEFTASEK